MPGNNDRNFPGDMSNSKFLSDLQCLTYEQIMCNDWEYNLGRGVCVSIGAPLKLLHELFNLSGPTGFVTADAFEKLLLRERKELGPEISQKFRYPILENP